MRPLSEGTEGEASRLGGSVVGTVSSISPVTVRLYFGGKSNSRWRQ